MEGKRVKLIKMDDQYTDLKSGDEGTIKFVDGIGQIHVSWDNGSTLALIPEIDEYDILESKKIETMKNIKTFEQYDGDQIDSSEWPGYSDFPAPMSEVEKTAIEFAEWIDSEGINMWGKDSWTNPDGDNESRLTGRQLFDLFKNR